MKKKPSRHRSKPVRTSAKKSRRPRFSTEVAILYEDDTVIVLDKPAGLLAVPIEGSNVPSAKSLLIEALKLKKQKAFVVHRIDRFASGILLFAKTGTARQYLVEQFLAHTPVREYLAVVRGRVEHDEDTLVHYFRREGMYQQLSTSRDSKAARAELHYIVESDLRDATLVRVELVTGLQNQIRAQFAALGHPLIGDRKYQRSELSEQLISRVALHATHLEFTHPRTGELVVIDSKLPEDFRHLLRELKLGA